MCGIAGFLGIQDVNLLRSMATCMKHRGPDDEGFYFSDKEAIGLAQVRLSIIDIESGHQPMWSKDGLLGVVFNGEIYNHVELRRELISLGYFFSSNHSDTEVLIYGYQEWGTELPMRLNGMFAFSVYDKKNRKIFFARDRFGQKPLYYSHFNSNFAFASELKTLLIIPSIKKEIDPIALQKYFAFGFIPAPYSLYKNIYKLPAGHWMTVDIDSRKLITKSYFKYAIRPDNNLLKMAEEELGEHLNDLLSTAVRRCMIADVPLGIFLSGGIDSSAVLALATKYSNKPLNTFSIGFHNKEYDESRYARKLAVSYGANHYEKIIDLLDVKGVVDEVLNGLDEPMADSSILPTFILSKFAKNHVKVALGGDGGDELFAGYAPFKALKMGALYQEFLPTSMREWILRSANRLPARDGYFSWDFKIKRTLRGLSYPSSVWNPVWMSPLLPEEIGELLHQKVSLEEVYEDVILAWNSSEAEDLIGKTSEFYTQFYLQNDILTKVDRASMMVGLEVRAPFLDNDVAEFAQRLPSCFKVRGGVTKSILKRSMQTLLPKSLLYRSKKGFAIPINSWLKSWPLADFNGVAGLSVKYISQLVGEHKAGIKDNRLVLWAIIVLSRFKKSLI